MRALASVLVALSVGIVSCAAEPVTPPKPKGPLGMSQDNPMHVERMSDEVDYMNAQRCEGGGHWRIGEQKPLPTPESRENAGCSLDKFSVTCSTTGEHANFFFMQCL